MSRVVLKQVGPILVVLVLLLALVTDLSSGQWGRAIITFGVTVIGAAWYFWYRKRKSFRGVPGYLIGGVVFAPTSSEWLRTGAHGSGYTFIPALRLTDAENSEVLQGIPIDLDRLIGNPAYAEIKQQTGLKNGAAWYLFSRKNRTARMEMKSGGIPVTFRNEHRVLVDAEHPRYKQDQEDPEYRWYFGDWTEPAFGSESATLKT